MTETTLDSESAPDLTTEMPEQDIDQDEEAASTGSNPDKTNELLAVVDEQESKDQAPEVFAAAEPAEEEDEEEDDDDDGEDDEDQLIPSEAEFFDGIEAPPVTTEDEKYDDDAAPEAMQATTDAIEEAKLVAAKMNQQQEESEVPPDFSQYKTNVAQRLWNAQQTAQKAGVKQSCELIRLLKEYQAYRKKIRNMIKAADDYQAALKNVTACRGKVSPIS